MIITSLQGSEEPAAAGALAGRLAEGFLVTAERRGEGVAASCRGVVAAGVGATGRATAGFDSTGGTTDLYAPGASVGGSIAVLDGNGGVVAPGVGPAAFGVGAGVEPGESGDSVERPEYQ